MVSGPPGTKSPVAFMGSLPSARECRIVLHGCCGETSSQDFRKMKVVGDPRVSVRQPGLLAGENRKPGCMVRLSRTWRKGQQAAVRWGKEHESTYQPTTSSGHASVWEQTMRVVRPNGAKQPDGTKNVWERRDPGSALPLPGRKIQRTEEPGVVERKSGRGKGGGGGRAIGGGVFAEGDGATRLSASGRGRAAE